MLSVINHHIGAAITYLDVRHGFRVGRGTGTTSLEDKPLQQLKEMREEVLYKVFLDLQKAYDALYWERCMEILVAYGVSPYTEVLLSRYWEGPTMVARAGC